MLLPAVTSLKLYGDPVPYQKISEEIEAVDGVVTHGLLLDCIHAAVIADGEEAKIVEKVIQVCCLISLLLEKQPPNYALRRAFNWVIRCRIFFWVSRINSKTNNIDCRLMLGA